MYCNWSTQSNENDLSPLRKILEISHPNIVLVEKYVSRYVQEFLFGKGITLVIDMKLHRLERITRCTGSEIIPYANSSLTMKLKQCDFFHFEKFSSLSQTSKPAQLIRKLNNLLASECWATKHQHVQNMSMT